MKILVCVKRVIDYKAVVRLSADRSQVETHNVKMSMNPFDEIALEEALHIKEKGLAKEVIVTSIGPDSCQETLKTALAMGADRAIQINYDGLIQPLQTAKLFQAIVIKESIDLVLLGKQAIDTDNNQVGQMLAGILGWAQGTYISHCDFQGDKVSVVREIDGGLETVLLKLPAILTTDLRLNTPRYISLPNIMKAKQKPLESLSADSLSVDLSSRLKRLALKEPVKRQAGRRVETVSELIRCLKQEAQVL